MKTIIGLYDDVSSVDRLIHPLMQDGVDKDHIQIVASAKNRKHFQKNSELSGITKDYKQESLHRELEDRGIPSADVHFFEQGVEQGHTLVILEVDDDRAPRVMKQMKNSNAQLPPQKAPKSKPAPTGAQARSASKTRGDTEKISVIEEELHVDKRVRETGGVTVERKVTSKPVRESFELEEERVEVSRKPINRAASSEDMMGAFEEGSIEMRERKEELVVTKEPRVVEEVEIKKTVDRHTETIDETLRRVDVDIRKIEAKVSKDMRFDTVRNDYRKHFDTKYKAQGHKFDDFEDAYRYGHGHALREDWRSHDFQTVSPHLRSDYEKRHGKGAWERSRGAVEHAWNNVRSRF